MSIARVMSHTPRIPLSCSHTIVVGASMAMPGTTSVPPTQARTSLIGPKSQSAVASLCQPSSNTRIPAALHLLELPLVAARRARPSRRGRCHHLHVVAAHLAERARLDRFLELPQRLVEEVVLHHAQHPVVRVGGVEHPLRVGEVVAHRLLQVDVPAVAEELDDAVGVQAESAATLRRRRPRGRSPRARPPTRTSGRRASRLGVARGVPRSDRRAPPLPRRDCRRRRACSGRRCVRARRTRRVPDGRTERSSFGDQSAPCSLPRWKRVTLMPGRLAARARPPGEVRAAP